MYTSISISLSLSYLLGSRPPLCFTVSKIRNHRGNPLEGEEIVYVQYEHCGDPWRLHNGIPTRTNNNIFLLCGAFIFFFLYTCFISPTKSRRRIATHAYNNIHTHTHTHTHTQTRRNTQDPSRRIDYYISFHTLLPVFLRQNCPGDPMCHK